MAGRPFVDDEPGASGCVMSYAFVQRKKVYRINEGIGVFLSVWRKVHWRSEVGKICLNEHFRW